MRALPPAVRSRGQKIVRTVGIALAAGIGVEDGSPHGGTDPSWAIGIALPPPAHEHDRESQEQDRLGRRPPQACRHDGKEAPTEETGDSAAEPPTPDSPAR